MPVVPRKFDKIWIEIKHFCRWLISFSILLNLPCIHIRASYVVYTHTHTRTRFLVGNTALGPLFRDDPIA